MINPFAKAFSIDQISQGGANALSTSQSHQQQKQESSLTDCHFFMTASCNKGNLCQFRHPEAAKKAGPFAPMCDEWTKYNCWDLECPNKHPARKANPNETICWFFVNQSCSYGDRCNFIHPIVDKSVKNKNKTKQISLNDLDSDTAQNRTQKRSAGSSSAKKGATLSFSLSDLEDDTPPSHRNIPEPAINIKRGRTFSSDTSEVSSLQRETPASKKQASPHNAVAQHSPKANSEKAIKKSPVQKAVVSLAVKPATPSASPGKRKRSDASTPSTQQTKKTKITPKLGKKADPAKVSAKKEKEADDDELAFLEGLI
eukprot:CAMPEP_0117445348 /NCGR_PEP_ID=MMETSP0759-20121206/5745_1 /TAXON_ID=63605 /ORGANISM="Percolomonas cosmopolitus, Strain WS" /LENGTH=313 /DNA_ID=CAMNT_0005237513 /DNA_START=1118 /DNA_END=2059 /DNA_ORIENTATION=-